MNRKVLIDVFGAALAAVDPAHAVRGAIRFKDNNLHAGDAVYDLNRFSRILVIGAGKATARMALALEESLGRQVTEGLIIVKNGHTAPLRFIEQIEASHPVPDERGQAATARILEMVRRADEKTLVLCLLSGGGSALLVHPVSAVGLGEKQKVTELLLKAGAGIEELNIVRKHLSAVKGGRLAQQAFPAHILTLILSDVVGDRLDIIASGPTVADPSTFADAAAVIDQFGIRQAVPHAAAYIERGKKGLEPETAKSSDPVFERTRNIIVGSLDQALVAARTRAVELGFDARILPDRLEGEAREAAHGLAKIARETQTATASGQRRCLISGGETTVTVRGNGSGGRNQELALAFAIDIEGTSGISLLSAGTDGTDGPTDAAGAVVDGETTAQARSAGLEPATSLDRNDSYSFFRRLDPSGRGCHLKTGPTGTNVMDVQIILVQKG